MDAAWSEGQPSEDLEEDWLSNQVLTLAIGLACGMTFHFLFKRFWGKGAQDTVASWIPSIDNKMVLVVRTDVAMTKGKVASQCAHAAIDCYRKGIKKTPDYIKNWERFGQAKITLKIVGEDAVKALQAQAEAKGLVAAIVRDAGRTQVDPGTITVIGIGPGPSDVVDSVTGHLKLY